MEAPFLGMPDVSVWLYLGLTLLAFCSSFLALVTGTAGGLLMLVILAMFFPPAVLIPLHTVHQLGANIGRVALMHGYVSREMLLPFLLGAAIGAFTGAQVFIALPAAVIQGLLAAFVLTVTWVPNLIRTGTNRGGFTILGFAATFLGIFVSATGTLVGSVLNKTTTDRREFTSTFAALMGLVHIAKLVAFGFVGLTIGAYLPLVATMIAAAFVANWLGRMVLDWMREEWFRTIFKVGITLLALRLLWVAAGELQRM